MAGIDRRRFLFAAVVTGAGLANGGSAWAAGVRTPAQARAATYRALVRALRAAPDGRFRHADPHAAYGRYARWYAAQSDAIQAHADSVLDAIESPTYAQLAAPRRDRATMAAAVALACIGCEPPPAADERPDIPTLAPA